MALGSPPPVCHCDPLILAVGVVCVVVAIMYWLGWELGAVEAISLSILVGSSVDYCLHLVEGFLLAGESMASWPDNSLVRHCLLYYAGCILGILESFVKHYHHLTQICQGLVSGFK